MKHAEVEHGSFTPIVLSATGGMAQEATMFYKLARCFIIGHKRAPWTQAIADLKSENERQQRSQPFP